MVNTHELQSRETLNLTFLWMPWHNSADCNRVAILYCCFLLCKERLSIVIIVPFFSCFVLSPHFYLCHPPFQVKIINMKLPASRFWGIWAKDSYNISGWQNAFKSQQNLYLTHQHWNQTGDYIAVHWNSFFRSNYLHFLWLLYLSTMFIQNCWRSMTLILVLSHRVWVKWLQKKLTDCEQE